MKVTEYQQHEQRTANPKRIAEYKSQGNGMLLLIAAIGVIGYFLMSADQVMYERLVNTFIAFGIALAIGNIVRWIYIRQATSGLYKDRNGEIIYTGDPICVYRDSRSPNVFFCAVVALDIQSVCGVEAMVAMARHPSTGIAYALVPGQVALNKD